MFPREQRLRTSQDIIAAMRKGKRVAAGAVTCSFLRRPATLWKATVVVDTKVSKKAVERNLLKRRIRMVLKRASLPGGDLVVRLRPGATKLSFDQLAKDLAKCLSDIASSPSSRRF